MSLLSKGELCISYNKFKFSHRSDGDGCFSVIVTPDDLDDVESDMYHHQKVNMCHLILPP